MTTPDDNDILSITAAHELGEMRFERVHQDRRTYYRMLRDEKGTGSLTNAKGARETIAYWRSKGWTRDCEICGEPAGAGGALCPVHLREAGIE